MDQAFTCHGGFGVVWLMLHSIYIYVLDSLSYAHCIHFMLILFYVFW